jgi:NAD(P)-dependent dehydrogenase (short-subunit alcohol dehydrogenase family)
MAVYFPLDINEWRFNNSSISLRGASMAETSSYQPPDLRNCVVLVAGATRGVGRGIALAFGEAGATVYCTGRSSRAALASGTKPLSVQQRKRALPAAYYAGRPETIEETAELVTVRGGKGIAVVVDHLEIIPVEKLVAKIRAEQGKLFIHISSLVAARRRCSSRRPKTRTEPD